MAKAKVGAKKAKPVENPVAGKVKAAVKSVAKTAGKTLKELVAPKGKAAKAPEPAKVNGKTAPAPKLVPKSEAKPAGKGKAGKSSKPTSQIDIGRSDKASKPRATKLPPLGEPLTKREMEQLLSAGMGRGVMGEGSLKGRLLMRDGLPHLQVIGRDKRDLLFLLQGPDQEVLPAYVDHKVSVSGRIHKTNNYGGTVDVRKYAAKKPEQEVVAPTPVEERLKYLSPGEIEQLINPGMGAGQKGFAQVRGNLEMTGEQFFLVVSHPGTRQQVSFVLEGKGAAKSLKKFVGQTVQVLGVFDKTSGWGGKVTTETVEPRPSEFRALSRDNVEIVHVEAGTTEIATAETRMNQGLTVRFVEEPGFVWAIEPTMAKRVGLREANFEPSSSGATREFLFTPRNPGFFEVDFYLGKAFAPAVVSKVFKLQLTVRP